MKKSILSVILLASGLLSGCSSEESVSRPETVGQTGTLTFSFPAARRSVTYAVSGGTANESSVGATEDEARINDVTIYMFKNSGVPDEEFLVAKKSESGVQQNQGEVQVTFDVSDFTNGGNYVFYAVANVSGNFTDNFVVGTATLNDFTAAVATATGTVPVSGSNMLMVGYTTIPDLSAGTEPVQEIILRHRVARFDIDNIADDGVEENNNLSEGEEGYNEKETFFTITKIHVLNTLSSGYLTEEDNDQSRVPLSDKVSLRGDNAIPVDGIANINNGLAEGAFYLWPGELAAESGLETEGSTIIEVEGYYIYDNIPQRPQLFTVRLASAQTVSANSRYILTVSRVNQTTLSFTLTPSGWKDDETVPASPSAGWAFEYGGFELDGVSLADDAPVDLSNKTEDSELRFYTDGDSKATDALKAGLTLTLGTDYVADVTPVPDGTPVVTYSVGKIRQYYKITLPKTTYPIVGTLTIGTAKEGGRTRELAVTSVPKYEKTDYKPVLVEGQYSEDGPADERKYWAPVNVGASSTTYSTALAGCGYYFQWGRNVPFVYNTGDTEPGPLSAEAASSSTKFITSASDWLSEPDNTLWSGDNAQGPCPDGW
ncbi:MAG: FimB/Mfa2 family fimbrial subunit, partial [Prevotella sp.]|nr:FimB/Mfa2 family fimbrial subunit [Prevotella sp.]